MVSSEGGSTPAVPDELTGLEDFDPNEDATIPNLRINHKENVFEDSQSGQKFESMTVVILGLVKQRILWDAEVEENSDGPMCRSYNFNIGHPQDDFPWKASGFDDKNLEALPCESCKLKDWGSHPKRDAPWCSKQYTLPVMRITEEGNYLPSLLTLQRSALKPANNYISSFAGEGVPLYTSLTTLSLDARKRGSVNFSVPKFARGERSEKADWEYFASNYKQIRDFVSRPWSRKEDEAEGHTEEKPERPSPAPKPASGPVETTGEAKPAKAAKPAEKPAEKPAPAPAASADDDDEIPF